MTKEQKFIKRDLQVACWIGEDGGMAIDGRFSKRYAWIQMRKLMRQDVGEYEAEELDEKWAVDYLQIGYLRLPDGSDIDNFYDSEWFITKNETPYKVWVFWG